MEQGWTTGLRAGGDLPLALHASFSGCLLELQALARQAGADVLVREALLAWRRVVPFDTGWWGEVANDPPRNIVHGSIGLADSFASEWNSVIAASDTFAQGSMAQPGTVFRASGGYRGPPGAIADFIDRHGLQAIMAITVDLPGSGVQFFIALYRGDPHDGFGDVEGALFAEFTRHLVQAWRYRLADLRMAGPLDALALSDASGRLCHVGRQVAELLRRHCGDWCGTVLPPALMAALDGAPRCIRFAGARLSVGPAGDLVAIRMVHGASALRPRELSAALLFAQGLSYKEVARALALSPATVRTYLKSAYAGLQVTNKMELVAALRLYA
ncbi:helix-turn-helix transcriptional regulator [Pseudoduganella sp. SL102]|uniref:helix-turn-helix transcriptional regulator n=1 Tax=Pseudoduganella sp. SL102 TaxID=2995154 RepID=UPI00248BA109|nr:helix-turn-helix transcriptional regulator [Pseudoduganella sp. SL102]WBS02337.1 helix-turn-helix transcriptional regulator [Pseudoduganella sp. SL102]